MPLLLNCWVDFAAFISILDFDYFRIERPEDRVLVRLFGMAVLTTVLFESLISFLNSYSASERPLSSYFWSS